jgi:hypothetical protein
LVLGTPQELKAAGLPLELYAGTLRALQHLCSRSSPIVPKDLPESRCLAAACHDMP